MTMSSPGSDARTAEVTATDVSAYLARHPDFFADHAAMLADLRLPREAGQSGTVSLVERQMDVLRDQRRELDLRLQELIAIGHANDALGTKMHRLACRLVRARGLRARLEAMESSLREDFGAPDFVLVLTRSSSPLAGIEARHLRITSEQTTDFRSFDSLISSGRPRCGQIRDSQRDFLFPGSGNAIGSVALVPLSIHNAAALLAIGSPNADHFNPTMATDYLARIGDLIATALDGAEDAP
jgi:uncharacterized protein YigA (DUF484 family)